MPTLESRGHIRQLDALRFFAILGVLVHHLWQPKAPPWIFSTTDWGSLGVRLFFVISGFLITGILLRGRELDAGLTFEKLFFIRQFYARRFLRIFPVYYAVLAIVVMAGIGGARHLWPWLAGYATNVYIGIHLHWIGTVSPFWSLAVEEQFYLVWPLLLLFLPRRWLLATLVFLLTGGPLFRLYESLAHPSDVYKGLFSSQSITLAVVDSLAMGALMALCLRAGVRKAKVNAIAVPVGAATLLTVLALAHYGVDRHAETALSQLAEAALFGALVYSASQGIGGAVGRILNARPLVYIGKISYGIYLFHVIVPTGFRTAARHFSFVPYAQRGFLFFLAASAVTTAVAALSWRFFEEPINSLKRHFPYGQPPARRPSLPAVEPTAAS